MAEKLEDLGKKNGGFLLSIPSATAATHSGTQVHLPPLQLRTDLYQSPAKPDVVHLHFPSLTNGNVQARVLEYFIEHTQQHEEGRDMITSATGQLIDGKLVVTMTNEQLQKVRELGRDASDRHASM